MFSKDSSVMNAGFKGLHTLITLASLTPQQMEAYYQAKSANVLTVIELPNRSNGRNKAYSLHLEVRRPSHQRNVHFPLGTACVWYLSNIDYLYPFSSLQVHGCRALLIRATFVADEKR
jgi:hypothetical protein